MWDEIIPFGLCLFGLAIACVPPVLLVRALVVGWRESRSEDAIAPRSHP
jgi:hypothetical protein